jgi:hypothetical protein
VIWLAADHTLIAGLPPLLRLALELAYRRCLHFMYEPITFKVNH